MSKTALYIGAGALGLLLVLGAQTATLIYFMRPQPTPVVPGPAPQQPLASLVTNAEHRAVLSAFYRDFAQVLAADTQGRVKTVGQFRIAQNNASVLLSQGQISYPAFAQAVSDRLFAVTGKDDSPIDATKRAAIVAALTAISTELGG